MKFLEPTLLTDLFSAFAAAEMTAKPEHIARHSHELEIEVEYLTSKQGFECLLNNGSTAFLKRGDQQIELILPESAPEHVGWIVPSLDDFANLHEVLTTSPWAESFTLLEEFNINRPDLKAMMFRHVNGAHIQFVWRKEPLFPNE